MKHPKSGKMVCTGGNGVTRGWGMMYMVYTGGNVFMVDLVAVCMHNAGIDNVT